MLSFSRTRSAAPPSPPLGKLPLTLRQVKDFADRTEKVLSLSVYFTIRRPPTKPHYTLYQPSANIFNSSVLSAVHLHPRLSGCQKFELPVTDTKDSSFTRRIKMSSLSRRACYKCGNVGHYAGMRTNRIANILETNT